MDLKLLPVEFKKTDLQYEHYINAFKDNFLRVNNFRSGFQVFISFHYILI